MNNTLIFTVLVCIFLLNSCHLFKTAPTAPSETTAPQKLKDWESVGQTNDGAEVYINAKDISYLQKDVLMVEAKTYVQGKEFTDLLEFDCPRYKFRILERSADKKPRWRAIVIGSPSKLIHNALCHKKK
jgi:hypothetical protein